MTVLEQNLIYFAISIWEWGSKFLMLRLENRYFKSYLEFLESLELEG